MPESDILKVLGIGVALSEIQCAFGAISLNQIPNDKDSITGSNVRGVYWTIADESGKEVSRDSSSRKAANHPKNGGQSCHRCQFAAKAWLE